MVLLFDIGGTKMRLARSRNGRSFEDPIIQATPSDYRRAVVLFCETAQRLTEGRALTSIVGGVAGSLDESRRRILRSPHLPKWNGKHFADDLEKALHAPVRMENDAAVVGLGEAVDGAGKGRRIVAYVTISTGVGGARIVGGKIDVHAYGFEPGHQIIDAQSSSGRPQTLSGQLESMVSGTAFRRDVHRPAHDVHDQRIWERFARLLAIGLHNTILHWSPDVVVLGGSMMVKRPGIPLPVVRRHLKRWLTIFPHHPPLVKASLGDLGGLHGALALLKQKR